MPKKAKKRIKKAAKRLKRPPALKKSEFLTRQRDKGRSEKEALNDWAMHRVMRRAHRYGRARSRRTHRRSEYAGRGRQQRAVGRILSTPRTLVREEVELQLRAHYAKLPLQLRSIYWLGGPSEFTEDALRSRTYLRRAAAKKLFGHIWFARPNNAHRLLLDAIRGPLASADPWLRDDVETPQELNPSRGFRRSSRRTVKPSKTLPVAVCLLSASIRSPELIAAAKAGMYGFWPLTGGRVAVLPAPTWKLENRQLHCDDGPAVVWPNGEEQFYLRGVCVPMAVVMAPETLHVSDINLCSNAEIRRIMVDRYGAERYLKETGAVLINESSFGKLWAKPQLDDDPLVMVEVVNSSPEPDGSYRHYFLQVPSDMRTARQAVAGTFGMAEGEYHPEVQT